MQDITPAGPEIQSPFNRPDRCPRCDALADRWVYIGRRMFLCADCHAELTLGAEPINLTPASPTPNGGALGLCEGRTRFLKDSGRSGPLLRFPQ
jgi:hypothetical protein